MTMPALPSDLTTNVVPGQSGHAGLHNEERAAINALIDAIIATRDRANHEGTQPISSVDLLQEALDARALASGTRETVSWNGTKYVREDGTDVTVENRVLGTYRDFVGGPDPLALGLMTRDMDAWDGAM